MYFMFNAFFKFKGETDVSLIKVLGIGSPFGDDQLGWRAIELIKQRNIIRTHMSGLLYIESYDRPGVHLLELMARAKTIFLIDAIVIGNTIGTLYRFQNKEIEDLKCLLSTHNMGVAEVLRLGKELNILPDDIIFYGIEINSVNFGQSISLPVESAINQLVECIENEIIELLTKIGIPQGNTRTV